MAGLRLVVAMSLAAITLQAPATAAGDQDAPAAEDEIAPAPAADADQSIVVEGEPDPMVCKRSRPPTASKIARSKKICKLQSEWTYERNELARRNREVMDGAASDTRSALSAAFSASSGRDAVQPSPPQ